MWRFLFLLITAFLLRGGSSEYAGMPRNLVLGTADGYTVGDVYIFVESLRDALDQGDRHGGRSILAPTDVVLIMRAVHMREELIQYLRSREVKVYSFDDESGAAGSPSFPPGGISHDVGTARAHNVQNSRFQVYADYLRQYGHLYARGSVLITDVTDVFFQRHPFSFPLLAPLVLFMEDAKCSEEFNADMAHAVRHYCRLMASSLALINKTEPKGMDQGVHNFLLHMGMLLTSSMRSPLGLKSPCLGDISQRSRTCPHDEATSSSVEPAFMGHGNSSSRPSSPSSTRPLGEAHPSANSSDAGCHCPPTPGDPQPPRLLDNYSGPLLTAGLTPREPPYFAEKEGEGITDTDIYAVAVEVGTRFGEKRQAFRQASMNGSADGEGWDVVKGAGAACGQGRPTPWGRIVNRRGHVYHVVHQWDRHEYMVKYALSRWAGGGVGACGSSRHGTNLSDPQPPMSPEASPRKPGQETGAEQRQGGEPSMDSTSAAPEAGCGNKPHDVPGGSSEGIIALAWGHAASAGVLQLFLRSLRLTQSDADVVVVMEGAYASDSALLALLQAHNAHVFAVPTRQMAIADDAYFAAVVSLLTSGGLDASDVVGRLAQSWRRVMLADASEVVFQAKPCWDLVRSSPPPGKAAGDQNATNHQGSATEGAHQGLDLAVFLESHARSLDHCPFHKKWVAFGPLVAGIKARDAAGALGVPMGLGLGGATSNNATTLTPLESLSSLLRCCPLSTPSLVLGSRAGIISYAARMAVTVRALSADRDARSPGGAFPAFPPGVDPMTAGFPWSSENGNASAFSAASSARLLDVPAIGLRSLAHNLLLCPSLRQPPQLVDPGLTQQHVSDGSGQASALLPPPGLCGNPGMGVASDPSRQPPPPLLPFPILSCSSTHGCWVHGRTQVAGSASGERARDANGGSAHPSQMPSTASPQSTPLLVVSRDSAAVPMVIRFRPLDSDTEKFVRRTVKEQLAWEGGGVPWAVVQWCHFMSTTRAVLKVWLTHAAAVEAGYVAEAGGMANGKKAANAEGKGAADVPLASDLTDASHYEGPRVADLAGNTCLGSIACSNAGSVNGNGTSDTSGPLLPPGGLETRVSCQPPLASLLEWPPLSFADVDVGADGLHENPHPENVGRTHGAHPPPTHASTSRPAPTLMDVCRALMALGAGPRHLFTCYAALVSPATTWQQPPQAPRDPLWELLLFAAAGCERPAATASIPAGQQGVSGASAGGSGQESPRLRHPSIQPPALPMIRLATLLHGQGYTREAAAVLRWATNCTPFVQGHLASDSPQSAEPGLASAAQLWSNLATLEVSLGDLEAALASVRRALALLPGYPSALLNHATILARLKRHAEAVPAYRALVAGSPPGATRTNALVGLGRSLEAAGSLEEAVNAYRVLLPNYMDNQAAVEASMAIAGNDRTSGNPGAAPVSVGETRDQEAEHYHDVARLLYKLGRMEEAEAVVRGGLARYPDHPQMLFLQASILFELDRQVEAFGALDTCQMSPRCRDASGNLLLGTRCAMLSNAGRHGDAASCFVKLVAAEPQNLQHRVSLAAAYVSKGDAYPALEALRSALRLAPAGISVHSGLGHLLAVLGRGAEATDAFNAAELLLAHRWRGMQAAISLVVARSLETAGANDLAEEDAALSRERPISPTRVSTEPRVVTDWEQQGQYPHALVLSALLPPHCHLARNGEVGPGQVARLAGGCTVVTAHPPGSMYGSAWVQQLVSGGAGPGSQTSSEQATSSGTGSPSSNVRAGCICGTMPASSLDQNGGSNEDRSCAPCPCCSHPLPDATLPPYGLEYPERRVVRVRVPGGARVLSFQSWFGSAYTRDGLLFMNQRGGAAIQEVAAAATYKGAQAVTLTGPWVAPFQYQNLNYYHWVAETLPELLLLLAGRGTQTPPPDTRVLLVGIKFPKFVGQYLDILSPALGWTTGGKPARQAQEMHAEAGQQNSFRSSMDGDVRAWEGDLAACVGAAVHGVSGCKDGGVEQQGCDAGLKDGDLPPKDGKTGGSRDGELGEGRGRTSGPHGQDKSSSSSSTTASWRDHVLLHVQHLKNDTVFVFPDDLWVLDWTWPANASKTGRHEARVAPAVSKDGKTQRWVVVQPSPAMLEQAPRPLEPLSVFYPSRFGLRLLRAALLQGLGPLQGICVPPCAPENFRSQPNLARDASNRDESNLLKGSGHEGALHDTPPTDRTTASPDAHHVDFHDDVGGGGNGAGKPALDGSGPAGTGPCQTSPGHVLYLTRSKWEGLGTLEAEKGEGGPRVTTQKKSLRSVENETVLVEALMLTLGAQTIGDVSWYSEDGRSRVAHKPKARLMVHDGSGSVRQQLRLFQDASLVIGVHGAGLANMVACQEGTPIVELPRLPMHANYFAHMAAALGLDYWVSPDLHSWHLAGLSVTKERTTALIDALQMRFPQVFGMH
eukprot:jgi/Mesvir1/15454/Mv06633-RA.2